MREKREETTLFIGKGGNPRSFTLVDRSPNGLSLINFWARNRAVTMLFSTKSMGFWIGFLVLEKDGETANVVTKDDVKKKRNNRFK